MTTDLRDDLRRLVRGTAADYLEIRVEEIEAAQLAYRGRDLETVNRLQDFGGCVRALVRGGWGFSSFNNPDELAERAADAVAAAALAADAGVRLAPVDPAEDDVPLRLGEDPSAVPLAEKRAIFDRYAEIATAHPAVATALLRYGDQRRTTTLATSEGTLIRQARHDVTAYCAVTAGRDGDVQQASFSLGWLNDFRAVRDLEQQVAEVRDQAVAFLDAPYARSGEYPVVLDPVLAGVFVHEAFGHLSEADFVSEDERLRELMKLGKRFGRPHLNIVDGAAVPGLRGSFRYDDEGVPAQRTDLVRDGVLVGRLHSRESAARMGERPTGNARAINYRFPPIVRMTNTFIEPGAASLEDLLADIELGVYARSWYGGMTSFEMFTFSAGEAYMIRDGKVAELVRPVQLSGNLFVTLEQIDGIAGDLEMNQGGGCGKGGQVPLPVSNGSPHVRIARCLVGGRA